MKCIVIGPSDAGKTSLCRALNNLPTVTRKTQAIEVIGDLIDTPGVYVTNPQYYPRLIVSSQQADLIIFLVSADQKIQALPPGFARAFFRPIIGVINKTDLPEADKIRAQEILANVGVKEPYFFISVNTGQGLDELYKRITTLKTI